MLAVETIIIPIKEGIPLKPCVGPEDRITDALEVMLKNDLKQIAVVQEDVVLGMINLEDALKKVGLEGDLKPRGKYSIVVHGRKIIVER